MEMLPKGRGEIGLISGETAKILSLASSLEPLTPLLSI